MKRSPSKSHESEPIIDRRVLASVGAAGSEFLTRIITRFLDEAQELEDELTLAIHDGDQERTRRIAHTLRGRAAMLGARALSAELTHIEYMAQLPSAEDSQRVTSQIEQASRELDRLRDVAWTVDASPGTGASLERLMLVDDDPFQRAVTATVLATIDGCAIHQCGSGEEALHDAPSFDPQVVLVDLQLPGIDGIETIERLLQDPANEQLAVVLMTASLDPLDHRRAEAAGALATITKPYDAHQLALEIERIWCQHREA